MKPNILFIVLDGLNAQKCFGKTKTSITPNLDHLIENGTYFNNSISSAPVTVPSVASILTSLYPHECMLKTKNLYVVNPKIETFIEFFKKNGYHTFATFQDVISYLGMEKIFGDSCDPYNSSKKLWNGLGKNILNRLEEINHNQPWLYYLQIYDLQWLLFEPTKRDNEGPAEFNDTKFGINYYERIVSSIDKWIGRIIEKIDQDNTIIIITADHGMEWSFYDSEKEKLDDSIRSPKKSKILKIGSKITNKSPKIFHPIKKKISQKYLQRKEIKNKSSTSVQLDSIQKQNISKFEKRILESIFEGKTSVYDDRFRVPLLFVGKNIPKKVIIQQVRSVDIFPTITELTGLPAKNDVRGQSLVPLMKGEKIEEEPAFLESATSSPLMPTTHTIGIRTSKYKYFRDRNNPKENVHLYSLEDDTLEENNIAGENLELIKKMEKQLKNIRGENTFNFKEAEEILSKDESEDALKILKELGYIKSD